MKKNTYIKFLIFFFILFVNINLAAQDIVSVQLLSLEGQTINKSNILNYQINNLSSNVEQVIVKGSLNYKGTKNTINYEFNKTLQPGLNQIQQAGLNIQYTFSSNTLKQLFNDHGQLPNGTFEYCVQVFKLGGESLTAIGDECIYSENEDNFLINLNEPEDNAKLNELYPMFSWTVNSSLISQLNYRIRVVEIKDGQNAQNAVLRNRPVYEQNGLRFLTQNYPVTAKQLEYFQPYAWTVDAYYKDILMGSAETWRFVIIDDSLMAGVPKEQSFVELNLEKGDYILYAVGKIMLKYNENFLRTQNLRFELENENGNKIKLRNEFWAVKKGENRIIIDFIEDGIRLKHLNKYILKITDTEQKIYQCTFRFINPDYFN